MKRWRGRGRTLVVATMTLALMGTTGCANKATDGLSASQSPTAEEQLIQQPSDVAGQPNAVPAPGASAPLPSSPTSAQAPAAQAPARGDAQKAIEGAAGNSGPATGAKSAGGVKGSAPCNGKQIVIGSVGYNSGVIGEAYAPAIRAVQTWVAATNAAGGLNCHKLVYRVADDGGDPARHQALVRQMVEQQGAIALVYNDAVLTAQASRDYLKEKKIPVIGQEGGQAFWGESPVHFTLYPAAAALMRVTVGAAAKVAIPKGLTKAAIVTCQEIEYCTEAQKVYESAGSALGFDIVSKASGSLAQPNFTAQCLGARNANAQIILGAFDAPSFHRFANDCAKINYRPVFSVTSLQADDAFKDDPNLTGAIIAANSVPWTLTNIPAVAAYAQAIAKFAPGAKTGPAGMNGWVSAKAFELAAQRAIAPDTAPTSAAVLKGLQTFKNETLGGLAYPLDFTGAEEVQRDCAWAVITEKGSFKALPKMFCIRDGKLVEDAGF